MELGPAIILEGYFIRDGHTSSSQEKPQASEINPTALVPIIDALILVLFTWLHARSEKKRPGLNKRCVELQYADGLDGLKHQI